MIQLPHREGRDLIGRQGGRRLSIARRVAKAPGARSGRRPFHRSRETCGDRLRADPESRSQSVHLRIAAQDRRAYMRAGPAPPVTLASARGDTRVGAAREAAGLGRRLFRHFPVLLGRPRCSSCRCSSCRCPSSCRPSRCRSSCRCSSRRCPACCRPSRRCPSRRCPSCRCPSRCRPARRWGPSRRCARLAVASASPLYPFCRCTRLPL
jgi:hypothetical protein